MFTKTLECNKKNDRCSIFQYYIHIVYSAKLNVKDVSVIENSKNRWIHNLLLQNCVLHRMAWFETTNSNYKLYKLIGIAFECIYPLKRMVYMFDDKKFK